MPNWLKKISPWALKLQKAGSPGPGSISFIHTFLATLAAILIVLSLRVPSLLETPELFVYDHFIQLRSGTNYQQNNVAVLAINEQDISKFNWPLKDEQFGQIIRALLKAQASVVALDIYRDVPIPPNSESFNQLLANENRVIGTFRFKSATNDGIAPPPAITDKSRIGFSDLPLDRDGTIRRGLLYLSDSKSVSTGLAMQATQKWLAGKRIRAQASTAHKSAVKLGAAELIPLVADFGGYHQIDSGGFQFLYDFRIRPEQIPVFSARDLLSGKVDPNFLKNRIIFIGVGSQSVNDQVIAPIKGRNNNRPTLGVLLHAYAADQLIRMALGKSQPIKSLSSYLEIFLIAFATFIVGVICLRVRGNYLSVLASLIWISAIILFGFVGFKADYWLPVASVVLSSFLALVLIIAYRSVFERRQRIALAGLLNSHVSPAIAQQVWDNRHLILEGITPKPSRLTASVMFIDLVGSTTIAETVEPKVLIEWVNRYLNEMTDCVVRHNGVVDKFTGDGLMAVFGIPVKRTTPEEIARDAKNAANCAIEMAARIDTLNRNNKLDEFPLTRTRIGIHTGLVSAGNFGTINRMQYTVIGQTANLAARLEDYGKDDPDIMAGRDGNRLACRILISGDTADCLNNSFDFQSIGDVNLRGAGKFVRAYKLFAGTTSTDITLNNPVPKNQRGV